MSAGQGRILVVDDERPIRRALEVTLTKAGYRVATAASAAETLTVAALSPPDLVVLDLMLPDGDGAEVCAELRDWLTAPILLISAVQDEPDKIRALDAGADDYLTKPFGVGELLARVRALLRRGATLGAPALKLLDLTLDPASREVTRGRRRITLTAREYALLEYFLRNVGRVLTRPMIAQHVWGLDFDPESNIVDVYVGYLRRKIDGEGDQRLLHTLRGAGYKLAAEE